MTEHLKDGFYLAFWAGMFILTLTLVVALTIGLYRWLRRIVRPFDPKSKTSRELTKKFMDLNLPEIRVELESKIYSLDLVPGETNDNNRNQIFILLKALDRRLLEWDGYVKLRLERAEANMVACKMFLNRSNPVQKRVCQSVESYVRTYLQMADLYKDSSPTVQ
jgi:hypothetical protein